MHRTLPFKPIAPRPRSVVAPPALMKKRRAAKAGLQIVLEQTGLLGQGGGVGLGPAGGQGLDGAQGAAGQ